MKETSSGSTTTRSDAAERNLRTVKGLIHNTDKALTAAKDLREDRTRLDEGVWKRLTDALLDNRSVLMKHRKAWEDDHE
jgi:hypothetical protein